MGETRRVMKALVLVESLSAVLLCPASFAAASSACLAVVSRAAQQAVERTPWIGQATAVGAPFALTAHVLRASVTLFGPQSAIFSVDVGVDAACNVLSTSVLLESNPWLNAK